MPKKASRKYHSPIRQQQADETRAAIAKAARKLIFSQGYEAAKMDAIAREAGVAVQTVYSVFGSKQAILQELLDQDSFGPSYQDLVRQFHAATDPEMKLRFPARIARQIHEAQSSTFDLFCGAGVVAPDLALLEKEREGHRYEAQLKIITILNEAGRLRGNLTVTTARDILWALTCRELYRLLVRDRGWSPQDYENWLADAVAAALLDPAKSAPPANPSQPWKPKKPAPKTTTRN